MKSLWCILITTLSLSACSRNEFDDAKGAFVSSCVSNGGNKQVCSCVVDQFVAEKSEEAFTALAHGVNDEDTQLILKAMVQCATK